MARSHAYWRGSANAVEFDEAVERAQQMRLGHVTFKRELVEQSVLLDFPLPHHRLPPSRHDFRKSDYYTMTDPVFFNTIDPKRPLGSCHGFGRYCHSCHLVSSHSA